MTKPIEKRWDNYYMCDNDNFSSFWEKYISIKNPNILFILGLGFDPRMCLGYESIMKINGKGKRDALLINFDEGPNSPSHEYVDIVINNKRKISSLIPSSSELFEKIIKMIEENRRIGSIEAASIIENASKISKYSDIIIDISSLPKGIYFPLIGKILSIIDYEEKSNINLHIIVAENVVIDKSIKERGISEDASYIHGFKGQIESPLLYDRPKIWLPILGENQANQLLRIGEKVNADEIFPLIPLPSKDPRRGDNLILEYRNLLFDRLVIDPNNFLYVAEKNPFEVYRRLYRTIQHYQDATRPLGGCTITISASSSKLLSIGALLVAYELKDTGVGVINVETLGYDPSEINPDELKSTELFSLWISGDCYKTENDLT